MASAKAIGGKFFARQMNEPHVAAKLAGAAQFHEHRRGEHERGRGGMVVVGSGRRKSRPSAAVHVAVLIFHIGRVVMVAHDHGSTSIAAGNDDHQVPFLQGAVLVPFPAAHPVVGKLGFPFERQVARQGFTGHSGGRDRAGVIIENVIAQRVEIAMIVGQMGERFGVEHAIGVILVDVLAGGEIGD